MTKHIKRWNTWRKRNTNGILYKILVLFKIVKSPSMAFTITPEEAKAISKAFEKGIEIGRKAQKGE